MSRQSLPSKAHEDLPERSREYAHYGEQGLAIPTYGDEDEEPERGVASVELGEPAAKVVVDVTHPTDPRERIPAGDDHSAASVSK